LETLGFSLYFLGLDTLAIKRHLSYEYKTFVLSPVKLIFI
jgi:hypothetical protein